LAELDLASRARLFVLADAILRAQDAAGFAVGGSNSLLNDGVAANLLIPHLHLHCIPRRRGDTVGFGLRLLARRFGLFGRSIGRSELDAVAAAIAQRRPEPFALRAGGGAPRVLSKPRRGSVGRIRPHARYRCASCGAL